MQIYHPLKRYAHSPGDDGRTGYAAARNLPAIGLYEKRGYQIARHEQLPDGLWLVHLQKAVVRVA